MPETWSLSGAEQARSIRNGRISSRELTEAVLGRIAALNPLLNAYCALADDALEQAGAADRALRDTGPRSSLHGVPISIKDLVLTRGLRTTFGSALYADYVPDEDDIVVERLRAAGLVVLGKTNVPEFGYTGFTDNAVFGPSRNPWDPERTPGGSSGGAAAAVAAGMGSLAIGSDGGGSVRTPASLCGIFGLKPTFGRVPLYPGCRVPDLPGASSWESLECIGPMTRTVEDAAMLLQIMAGDDPRDRHSLPAGTDDYAQALAGGVRGLRVAWSPDFGGTVQVDPAVAAIAERAARLFASDLGCELDQAFPDLGADANAAFLATVAHDTDLAALRRLALERRADLSAALLAILDREWTAEEFSSAAMAQQQVTNALNRFMARYDLLLTPTTPTVAYPIADGFVRRSGFTGLFNLTGQPAASVPAGFTAGGLPVGLQIAGRRLHDATVLRAAAAFEQVHPWADRWPSLL